MANRKRAVTSNSSENTNQRKGRGRPQPNSPFVASENSVRQLTPEEKQRAKDFYQASRIHEIQLLMLNGQWEGY